jgi:DNA-binding CsgD family transcriptional regulator
VPDRYPLILDRDAELAAAAAAATAAAAGHGALILLQGPAGTGRTTVLEAARAAAAARGLRALTARGFALEQEFAYGIVQQLLEPVRAAAGPADWDALTDGAARPARRLLDGPGPDTAGPGRTEPDAILHGLYRLTASLADREPLVLAVDDAHWADAASLRWLSHLAARVDGLPLLLLLAVRSGPGQSGVLSELRGYPACAVLELRPLDADASAALVRNRLGGQADPAACRAAHTVTRGNPFLLDALAGALRDEGLGGPGGVPDEAAVLSIGPRPVADAAARRIGPLGEDAVALTRALAVLGRPAPLRHVAALASLDLPRAALLADRLRAANVLGPGTLLEFQHPVERTALYAAIPPGERALVHARTADLLEVDGADSELIALHLLGSEPAADNRAVTLLRAAAASAAGRGAPAAAAGFLRRALAEPPAAADRAGLLLDLGLTLARDRDQDAVAVLGDAVAQAGAARRPGAALLSAGVLGVWGHHHRAAETARTGLAVPGADPLVREQLEAELLANSWLDAAAARPAWERAGPWLVPDPGANAAPPDPGAGPADWPVYGALAATIAARRGSEATARLAPVLAGGPAGLRPDATAAVIALLVLTWNDELEQALAFSAGLLTDAKARGSLNTATAVRGLRALILRRLGRLQEAAVEAQAGFDFSRHTSPPLAVAWSAAFLVETLTKLGRLAEAEEAAATAQQARPPDGWLASVMLLQARGALRVAEQRYADGLADLRTAAEGWQALNVSSPAAAYWRVPAVLACSALDRDQEAARLAAEQLELARAVGTPVTLGVSLRIAAPFAPDPERALTEAIALLTAAGGQYEQGLALADLGAYRRRAGRRTEAREPLRLALDYAERAGAEQLRGYARAELLAVGARPRRAALTGPDALTGAERQVAELAAAGRSNRQIAQQLFIAQATVETHLRHAFHKLGITSRTDLPARWPSPVRKGD